MKFFQRNRSDREEALLDAMLKSPLADQVVQELEDATLTARRELLAQISALDRDRPAEAKRLQAAAILARQQLDTAESAFRSARAMCEAAQLQGGGFEQRYAGARMNLELELVASADQRLWAFAFQATQSRDNACQAALTLWMDRAAGDWLGREFVLQTNIDHVSKAKDQLSEAAARCREAQLQPLTASDVSMLLDELCHDLAPSLARLELNPPCLTNEHHDVGAPLPWRNKSEWLVDKIPAPTKKDRVAAPRVRQARDALSRLERS